MSARHPGLDKLSSIHADGSRDHVHPADVRGRFTRARRVVFAVLIAIYATLPWVRIDGNPAIRIDIPRRVFYLFGHTYNAQDFWLAFYFVAGVALVLLVASAVVGRVWCGWACPQTVFLEAVFRPVERLIEGPRSERLRRNAGPWGWDRLWRKTARHTVQAVAAFVVAHVFLSYFTSLDGLWTMMREGPLTHPTAFAWAMAITAVTYFNFWWFREQLCLVICPYGRLQSVLTDPDTVVIGYDRARGEPRGKAASTTRGDCIDCGRCVAVCPTAIDIRNGLQLECIGCTACVDACDEIMVKVGQPPGLIRHDSERGFSGGTRRLLRPRLALYAAVLLVLGGSFVLAARGRRAFEATLLRQASAPYVVEGGLVRNQYNVHLVSKSTRPLVLQLEASPPAGVGIVIPRAGVALPPFESVVVPLFATLPESAFRGPFDISASVRDATSGEQQSLTLHFRGPSHPPP